MDNLQFEAMLPDTWRFSTIISSWEEKKKTPFIIMKYPSMSDKYTTSSMTTAMIKEVYRSPL